MGNLRLSEDAIQTDECWGYLQKVMEFCFREFIGKSIAIYLDYLTVFSKKREEYIKHLRRVIFKKCRVFNVSLNPKKSRIGLTEGNLLRHIITKEGAYIDPE